MGSQVSTFVVFHVFEVFVLSETDIILGEDFESRTQKAHHPAQLFQYRSVFLAISQSGCEHNCTSPLFGVVNTEFESDQTAHAFAHDEETGFGFEG
jgi:hypothetical protein